MIGSASPSILQGACSRYPAKRAAHSKPEGMQNLRLKGACPMGAQLFPSGIKVSPLSLEGPQQVRLGCTQSILIRKKALCNTCRQTSSQPPIAP